MKLIFFRNPDTTLRKIIEELNLGVCRQTLSKVMKKLGFINVKKPIKPRITPTQKLKRLEFAKKKQTHKLERVSFW